MKRDSLWHDKTILAICLGVVLLMAGQGFVMPILPKFVLMLSVAPTQVGTMVGLAMSVFGIGRAVMNLPSARIARLWGRRPLLILGPALVTVGALGCGLAIEYWQLLVFRLLQGLGSAAFTTATLIVMGELSTPSNRGRYMSFYWGSILIGVSLGPTLGGFVGQYLGCRVPFFCSAGLAFLSTVWGYFRIPETKGRKLTDVFTSNNLLSQSNSKKRAAPLYQDLSFILTCTVSFCILLTLSGNQMTLIPILGYQYLNLVEGQVGLILALIFVVEFAFVFLAGGLSDKLGRKIIIVPGGIMAALGLVLFTQSHSYWFLLLSGAMLGAGRGLSNPTATAYVVDIASVQDYEHTMALYRTVSDVGYVVGPILLGWLKDTRGLDFPFFLAAGLLLGAIILFAALAKGAVSHGRSRDMML